MVKRSITASLLAIIPIFVLLLVTYPIAGHTIPTDPMTYLIYASLTVFAGLIPTYFFGLQPGPTWAAVAGTFRWGVILLGIFIPVYVLDGAAVLTYVQFGIELPMMMLGYWAGARLSTYV